MTPEWQHRIGGCLPGRPSLGLSPSLEAPLNGAGGWIFAAPAGEEAATLTGEAFAIGRLAGAGGMPVRQACDDAR